MAVKKQCKPEVKNKSGLSFPNLFLMVVIVVCLLLLTVSSLTNTAFALKSNSQGKSNVVRQNCMNGLQNAAIETGICTFGELMQFNNVLAVRESQGVKAAKDICFSQMTSEGCRGLCVAAVNCYDIQ